MLCCIEDSLASSLCTFPFIIHRFSWQMAQYPGALPHVLADGALPSETFCVKTLKVRVYRFLFLAFHSSSGSSPNNVGFSESCWRGLSSQPPNNSRRNKGSKPVRTHMKLAKYRSHTAVRSAFCGARSQHLVRTTWLRQRNSIWLSNHQSTTVWPREWIQLDNTVETWLLGLVAK